MISMYKIKSVLNFSGLGRRKFRYVDFSGLQVSRTEDDGSIRSWNMISFEPKASHGYRIYHMSTSLFAILLPLDHCIALIG
jgi:hypothetical protein